MTHRPARAAIGAVSALVLLAGCGGEGTGDKQFVEGSGGVIEFAVKDRKAVQPVEGETLQGKKLSLKELADGRPVVVNVWAPWCGPCRGEAEDLNKAAERLGDKAAFLGISIRTSSVASPLAYERRYGVTYPSLWDPDGQTLLAFPSGTAAAAIPSTVVIDSDGKVSATIPGPIPSAQTLVTLVEDAG